MAFFVKEVVVCERLIFKFDHPEFGTWGQGGKLYTCIQAQFSQ